MFTADARDYLRATYAKRAYSQRMPTRGKFVEPMRHPLAMVLSDEDRVLVALGRQLRAASVAEYDRFLRLAAKSLMAASLRKNDRRPVDLTAESYDGLLI